MSKCSHKISPMKGGVRSKNDSFPKEHISFPRIMKFCGLTPSKLNSLFAQFNQCATSTSDHWRGSNE